MKAKPLPDLPEFELMRYLGCGFSVHAAPGGYVIILSCEVHQRLFIFSK